MAKVLVTGGAGFIGSNLAEYLVQKDYQTVVLDNLYTGREENLQGIRSNIEFILGDILDLSLLERSFRDVDYVFHQAALKSVPLSFETPAEFIKTNILGTRTVLEAAKKCGVRRVIFASSSSVYGDAKLFPQKEGSEGTCLSPYALSKRAGEDLLAMYYAVYGLETVSLRYFNVFGERQDPKSQYAAAIPRFIATLLQDGAPTIFGDGTQARDFTHVANVVYANVLAMTAPVAGMRINVANGKPISVNQLANSINELLGKRITPLYAPSRTGDVKNSCADISRAQEFLGYQEQVGFKEGLERTIAALRST